MRKGLVYEDLRDHVSGIANVETFGARGLQAVRLALEEECKKGKARFTAARVDDIATYALLPDVETFPVLLLLLGAQAAGDMGLTDPTWAYVLQEAGRVGITTFVWGEVPKAPRAVHAGFDEGVAVIGGRRPDQVSYTLPSVRFAPAILSPDVRAEAAAVLGAATPAAATTAPVEPDAPAEAALPEHIQVEEVATIAERPSREAIAIRVPEKPERAAEKPERAIYCLGGLRVEHKGCSRRAVAPPRRSAPSRLSRRVGGGTVPRRGARGDLAPGPARQPPQGAQPARLRGATEARRRSKLRPLIVVVGDRYRID